MRYYYAQIDENNRCIGWLDTFREINAPNMIPIELPDDSYLGRTWDAVSQTWNEA